MRSRCFAGVAALLLVSVFSLTSANAITYNLDNDNCSGVCNNGAGQPFGTVQVLQNGANLDFTVTLNFNYVFQKSTGLNAFTFGFSGDPAVTITNLSAGFSVDPSATNLIVGDETVHQDGFGDFGVAILKAATGGQSLTFTVLNQTLGQLALSTGSGDEHVLFSADISAPNVAGNPDTGPVGSGLCVTCTPGQEQFPTPIPGAVWLFGTVLAGGAGYGRWRKKRKAQLATAA